MSRLELQKWRIRVWRVFQILAIFSLLLAPIFMDDQGPSASIFKKNGLFKAREESNRVVTKATDSHRIRSAHTIDLHMILPKLLSKEALKLNIEAGQIRFREALASLRRKPAQKSVQVFSIEQHDSGTWKSVGLLKGSAEEKLSFLCELREGENLFRVTLVEEGQDQKTYALLINRPKKDN